MPEIFRENGYRFYFYASDRKEPIHVHVKSGKKEAKYWLKPFVRLEYNHGFRGHELTEIERLIGNRLQEIVKVWNDYFKP